MVIINGVIERRNGDRLIAEALVEIYCQIYESYKLLTEEEKQLWMKGELTDERQRSLLAKTN